MESNTHTPSSDSAIELLNTTISDEFVGRYDLRAISKRLGDLVIAVGEDTETGESVSLLSGVGFNSTELIRAKFRLSRLSRVSSPSLRRVFDFSVSDEGLVLVEAEVAGQRLDELVSERLPTMSDALRITKGVLSALRDLHQHQLMHLSLRPRLITVDDESVTLSHDALDFHEVASTSAWGIARARFTSPEQAGLIERDVTFSADLYSSGALLHYLLTGRPPFEADDLNALLLSHMVAPVPNWTTWNAIKRHGRRFRRSWNVCWRKIRAIDTKHRKPSSMTCSRSRVICKAKQVSRLSSRLRKTLVRRFASPRSLRGKQRSRRYVKQFVSAARELRGSCSSKESQVAASRECSARSISSPPPTVCESFVVKALTM